MAITVPTLAELNQTVLAFYRARFPARDLGTESFLGKKAAAEAMMLYGFYKAAADADADALPSSLTSASRLDEFASTFGLSNGAGGFGRKGASGATGGAGTVTYAGSGPFPYTLADGTALTASDGTTQVELDGALVFASAGSMTGAFAATTTGIVGNLAVGQQLTFNSTISGLTPTVTLSTALSNGTDRETDADLLARLIDRLQNPPAGATAAQYRIWCNAQTNVHQTYVYPLRSGTGTVDMVIVGAGHGGGGSRPTGHGDGRSDVHRRRSAGSGGGVGGAAALHAGAGHSIKAEVVATAGNESDVLAGGRGLTVSAYSAIEDADSLGRLARARYSRSTPTGSSRGSRWRPPPRPATSSLAPLPEPTAMVTEQIKVTAYNPSTHVCTLAAPFTVAPTVGDSVYSGGNVVETISGNLSRHVDALGPSTAGGERIIIDGDGDPHTLPGFAYLQPPWNDTLVIDRIGAICLDATDANGATLCANIVRTAFVPQVFVDGASDNIRAGDDGTNAPEMLHLKSINVIQ
jgi:uncharacterized phage protein gp47/JayE